MAVPESIRTCERCGSPLTQRQVWGRCRFCSNRCANHRAPAAERFWARVDPHGPTHPPSSGLGACWIWTGSLSGGYGSFTPQTSLNVNAHRWAYEYLIGPVPPGLTLDHLCRIRSCCHPLHLEAVTHRVNILRGNGASAHHARKTHCKRGHAFTPENTIRTTKGRGCRTCHYATARRRNARLRELRERGQSTRHR